MDAELQQAIALHRQGALEEAEPLYRAVLAALPDHADAMALLGMVRSQRKDHAEAATLITRALAIDPGAALFYFYLGTVKAEAGDHRAAADAFRKAVALKPDYADAHYRLGLSFEKKGRTAEAAAALTEASRHDPGKEEIWLALSDMAGKTRDYALAHSAARHAVALNPRSVVAQMALGIALDFLDREEEALTCYAEVLRLKPDFVEAWDLLGATYQNLGLLGEAETAMRKALTLAGGIGPRDDGEEIAEKDYTVQHWNLALLELLSGDYLHGFDHYRARFKKTGRAQRLPFPRPVWRGEDLNGKKILVVGEQGFGDVIMLARYLPLLKARGAKPVLLTHGALERLMNASGLIEQVIVDAPVSQGDYHFQTSLFDLPFRFGTTPDTVPANILYIPSPPSQADTGLPNDRKLKVGVVWSGRSDFANDRRRSPGLSAFLELFRTEGVQFYNLTRDLKRGDDVRLAATDVVDLSLKLNDFFTTAQYVAQMDIVIACDTAVAHLAGAMGKTVWTLLPYAPDWRWMMAREDSVWYPSMRLFRQRHKAEWGTVIARVGDELRLAVTQAQMPKQAAAPRP